MALESSWDQHFLPGAVKYGDISAFLILNAPHKLWLLDSDKDLQKQVKASYESAGAADALTLGGKGEWLQVLLK